MQVLYQLSYIPLRTRLFPDRINHSGLREVRSSTPIFCLEIFPKFRATAAVAVSHPR